MEENKTGEITSLPCSLASPALTGGEQQTNFYHERSEGNKVDFGGWQSVLIVVLAIQENEKHAHEIAGEVKWHNYCLVKISDALSKVRSFECYHNPTK